MARAPSKEHNKRLPGKDLLSRHKKKINDVSGNWQKHYDDIRDFAQPYRQPVLKGDAKGRSRTTKVYDSTAVVSAWRGAHKLRSTLTPDFKEFFALSPGPMVTDPDDRQSLKRLLDGISKIAVMVFNQGDFSAAADEFYQDLYAGDAHMLVLRGNGLDNLVDFIALPAQSVHTEDDSAGRRKRWMFLELIEVGNITERWPEAKLTQRLQRLNRAHNGAKEVEITIACSRQARTDPNLPPQYDLQVLDHETGEEIWHEELRTSCFVSGRFFKVPGETRGRGPLMLALPHIKTLNKAVELQLKAAAFAVLGAWMTNDDGVYNPRTSVLTPGGMLKVKSTGGRRGASIADLGLPKQFDVAQLVSNEMRMQIREMLLDQQLPPEEGAVRSPTEIIARLRRLTDDIQGAFGRMYREILIPLVQRVLDILDQWDLLPTLPQVDNLFVSLQILSPLAEGQALEEAERATRWLATALEILGPEQIDLVADRTKAAVYLHEVMGAPNEVIQPPDQRKQNIENARALAEQAVTAQVNAAAEGQDNGPTGTEAEPSAG
jgi:hypothetical protein